MSYRETRTFDKVKGPKIRIHADANGTYNIIRKHIKNAFQGTSIRNFLHSPKSIHVFKYAKKAKLKASV
ncbi:hypothetical protein BKP35_08960 [Anaerobacillus arseniciselenatis]|uniref:Uncharacterized protein n=1 Tax=Anaerobacillus arseniciselenatis TaxID=85682 RepID=A0A1S2LLY8_9BACI|nr:hypothetical protein BKP35_08960 [Anaerobacillus arseniciselenatis]